MALVSEGRREWVVGELGMLYAKAINVPLSIKIDELAELKFRIAHSGARLAMVSKNHLQKIRSIKSDLPDLEKVILIDEVESMEDDEMLFSDIMAKGKDFLANKDNMTSFNNLWQSIKEEDIANISYTSGTTANPKGIMLTHRNYTANVEQSVNLVKIQSYFKTLLILPLDHAFAHTCGTYCMFSYGASFGFIQQGNTPLETLKNIPHNIKELKPHLLLSVPALAKNFKKNIIAGVKAKGPKVEKLFNKALKLAYEYNGLGFDKGKGKSVFQKIMLSVYDKIIFKKIRDNFGGNLEYFIGGGAFLDLDIQKFFYAIGIPMYQGYGLSEASPVISSNSKEVHKLGTSGTVAPWIDIKIVNEQGQSLAPMEKGEIMIKGENVMKGYWNNPAATEETLEDGWLHTGDLGYMDDDGFLYVLGRQKSLLISSDGEKYSPEGIEEALTEKSPYIEQVLIYNDHSPYTVGLIFPNRAKLLEALQEKGLTCHQEEGQNYALELIEHDIEAFIDGKYKEEFPSRWLPTSIAILGEGFTEQNHFLNSTLKMVRPKIVDFYKTRIEYMFTPEGKKLTNPQNKRIISRIDHV